MARVLLVDDDPGVVSTLSKLLAQLGHQALAAADGRVALARLRDQDVDVILLDILMPEVDGLELIRLLARERPGVKVIAMSGGSARLPGADVLQLARTLGAHSILSKPFGSDDLGEAIRGVLDEPRRP